MTIRERTQQIESEILSPFACLSAESKGRKRPEPECPIRTLFQRDRDRIIHSKSFRRLKHKTQVFLAPEGDHYRTRLTHTLEVSQIARTLARALRLNEDLAEAIALGHDLGHTPFGHAGERALREVSSGFNHYEQSVRVVEKLENGGRGLNVTYEVIDGILHHTTGEQPSTLEGQIVRLSDRIAYINHDIDDALRAEILKPGDIPKELGSRSSERITAILNSIIESSRNKDRISMDRDTEQAFDYLHGFMFEYVYTNHQAKSEEAKAMDIVKWLYGFFMKNKDKLTDEYLKISEAEGLETAVKDYIAGMSDRYAIHIFTQMNIPKSWAKL